jgi:hypothetical protein
MLRGTFFKSEKGPLRINDAASEPLFSARVPAFGVRLSY